MTELPQIAVEYIDEVIRKMRWRRKVREDVRQELVDHFTDALDHISGEAERQKEAQKLITEFGDAAVLGKLMRRAKKRCRPWWVKFMIRSCQFVGAFILLVAVYSAWFLSGKPVITTNYVEELNRIVRPDEKVSDDENAAISYDEAVKFYKPFFKEEAGVKYDCNNPRPEPEGFDPSDREYSAITPEDEVLLHNWLAENAEALELWTEGSKKQYFWRKYEAKEDEYNSLMIPNLADYRHICNAMLWRAYLEAKSGNIESAFSDISVVYKSGMHLKDQQTLIEQLVGMAILRLASNTLDYVINDFDIDRKSLEYLTDEFKALAVNTEFALNFDGEKYFALDEIQRSFVSTPIGSHLYLKRASTRVIIFGDESFSGFADKIKLLFVQPDKEVLVENVNEFYEKLIEYSNKMPYQIADIGNVMAGVEDNIVLSVLMPAFDKIISLSHRMEIDIQSTVVILAVHLYKADNGSFPESLDRLMCDGYIESVPIDPFSGKQLAYRKTDNSFVLYSVGTDRVDNGGKAEYDKEGNIAKWPKKDGYDAVFWPVD